MNVTFSFLSYICSQQIKFICMTKKFFFTLLVGCFYLTNAINAQTEVNLVLDRGSIVSHGHPQAVPTVTTNGDEIDIKCDSVISNVDVVIKDQYGTVILTKLLLSRALLCFKLQCKCNDMQ